jgi:hypothetical protein
MMMRSSAHSVFSVFAQAIGAVVIPLLLLNIPDSQAATSSSTFTVNANVLAMRLTRPLEVQLARSALPAQMGRITRLR